MANPRIDDPAIDVPKIDVVLDIDGVLVAQHSSSDYNSFSNPKHPELIPPEWRNYHKDNIISICLDDGVVYHYLLAPHVLVMLQFFFINLSHLMRVSAFSAAPETRNRRLMEILIEKVATRAGVEPSSLKCPVFSFNDCTQLSMTHPLQPNSDNSPHIPTGRDNWYRHHTKKILSGIFGPDISNVIIVENSRFVMIRGETDHQLKVPTFYNFSGLNFQKYKGSTKNQRYLSYMFLGDPIFFRGNAACLITGKILQVLICVKKLKLSASSALKLLEVCVKTNKYKTAINTDEIWLQYDTYSLYMGYLILNGICPIQLFSPYPDHALETLKLLRDQCNGFIKDALIQAHQYWPPNIYDIISECYGISEENDLLPECDTASPTAIEIQPLEMKTPLPARRHSIYLNAEVIAKQGLFSKKPATTPTTPLLRDGHSVSHTPKSTCCAIL